MNSEGVYIVYVIIHNSTVIQIYLPDNTRFEIVSQFDTVGRIL